MSGSLTRHAAILAIILLAGPALAVQRTPAQGPGSADADCPQGHYVAVPEGMPSCVNTLGNRAQDADNMKPKQHTAHPHGQAHHRPTQVAQRHHPGTQSGAGVE